MTYSPETTKTFRRNLIRKHWRAAGLADAKMVGDERLTPAILRSLMRAGDYAIQPENIIEADLFGLSFTPAEPSEPTIAPPGSAEKIAEMAARVLRGEEVHHPRDADGHEGTTRQESQHGRPGG